MANVVLPLLLTLTFLHPRTAIAAVASPALFSPEMPFTRQQLNNIVEALIGTGDFGNWAGVLSTTDPSTFPITATLFVPSDEALSRLPSSLPPDFYTRMLLYHVVPQQLSFSDLQRLIVGTRLLTLLSGDSILVTNNSKSNYTIDDSRITHPDLYANGAISVHGIHSLLNYSVYGGSGLFEYQVPRSPQESPEPRKSPEVSPLHHFPVAENLGHRHSDAPCSCTEFPIILSVICASSVLKILRNPLSC